MTTSLAQKIVAIGTALDQAALPYGFGGALALAWCTQRARTTIDIDVNIFVDATEARQALEALPLEVAWTERDLAQAQHEGQIRLWWGTTPIDVFLDTSDFHRAAATRVRRERFADADVAFLACPDLAVFKVFFNRTQDWADLEEMAEAESLDVEHVLGAIVRYLGADDERVERLRALVG